MRILSMVLGIVLTAVASLPAHAQFRQPEPGTLTDITKPVATLKSMSLLDPDRFTMSQQSVFSYSSSNMAGSNMMGMYINTMEYRFNMPLTMRMKVAYQNDMGSLLGNRSVTGGHNNMETGRLFIPAVDLIYHPWENTTLSLHYRDFSGMTRSTYGMGAGYSPYARYYDPFGLYQ